MNNPTNRTPSIFLSTAALIAALLAQQAHGIALTSSAGSTLTYFNETVTVDADFILTHEDPNISGFKIIISNPSTGDSLDFTDQNGITGSFDDANISNGYILTLSGDTTIEDYQAAIRSITISTSNTAAGNRNVSFAIDSANVSTIYNSLNGHFYQYRTTYPTGGSGDYDSGNTVDCSGTGYGAREIDDGISWTESKEAAAQFDYFGWTGYLATIASADENAFLFGQINNTAAWIGASDDPSQTGGDTGDWEWVTGPEAGTLFWSEVDGDAFNSRPGTGSAQGGQYSNWHNGSGVEEPNNYTNNVDSPVEGESYAHFLGDQGGTWNDLPNIEGGYKACGYLVEFGGMPGDTATLAAQKVVSVTATNQAPTSADTVLTGLSEDTPYTFSTSNFTFTDADGADAVLDHITLETLPNPGTLTLSGSGVSIGETVAKSQISSLVFTPASQANGDDYTNFTFSVNDGFDDSAIYTMTLDVDAVNDPPTMLVTLGSTIVENNASDTTVVANFIASDVDGTPTITFTAGSNTDAYYEIVGSTVELTLGGASFVNGGGSLPALNLTATDDIDGALSASDTAIPVITPSNDTPQITLTLGSAIDEESASDTTIVASFTASDEEGLPSVDFTAGSNTDGYYEIVGTDIELTTVGANFVTGSGSLPSLSLTATDDSNNAISSVDAVLPVITAFNDTPELTVTLSGAILEGTAVDGTIVASFVATDEDGSPSVGFSTGSNDDGYYRIVGSNIELTSAGADAVNAGNSLPSLSLIATDDTDAALTSADAQTPTTTESNDTPTLTLTLAGAIVEGSATDSTVVASFVAADEDGTPNVSFTALSNTESYYEIVGTNIELTDAGANFVNSGGTLPLLNLTATDDIDGALTVAEAKTPTVTLTNDAPTLSLTLAGAIVEGNATNSSVVASFIATDEDGSPAVTFTAGSNADGFYTIIGTDIVLTQAGADFVNGGGTLPALSLTVTDDADGAMTAVDAQSPTVTPTNDAPTLTLSLGGTIVEGSANDATVVASFIASDEDGTPTVDFSPGTNAEGYYEIVGTNIELTQAGADFVNGGGTLPAISLTATDDTTASLTAADAKVPVVAEDNDTPTLSLTLATAVIEDSASDATIVASFTAEDEDGTPTVSFSPGTNSDGYYEIVGTNIELSQAGAEFVNAGGRLPALSLTATDDANDALTAVDSKTPVVTAFNDTPTLSITLGGSITEGAASTAQVLASYAANDEDGTPVVAFSPNTNTEGYYEITGNNITLTQAGADFVNAGGSLPSISLTVSDDSDGLLTVTNAQTPVILPTIDKDRDGIPDSVEGTIDTDGDGTPNDEDTDSDNDGIDDIDEGVSDSDGDGTPDYLDSSQDEDGDGIPDIVEGTNDFDGDGIPNFLDSDSDNDGLSDSQEAGITGNDVDLDTVDDHFDVDQTDGADIDSDGIDDAAALQDTDGDGAPDYLDFDSDGDGIPDAIEVALTHNDTDEDGIDDRVDSDQSGGIDSDADSIDDAFDASITGGLDANADGIDDLLAPLGDNDNDGLADHLDPDSDNDGISDRAEGNASGLDSDNDGIDDAFDVDVSGGTDSNQDGIDDAATVPDSDSDSVADLFDLDSDNDGLFDTEEAGIADVDANGLADSTDSVENAPIDSDNDGIADYRDLDSDNDDVNDISGTAAAVLDTDLDGRIDITTDSDGDGIDDLWDEEPDTAGSSKDLDKDGTADYLDLDIDGDGIDNISEGAGDSDGDGIPNSRDTDSDNDGLSDLIEASAPNIDIDGDGIPNYLDLDSDNDGIPDGTETNYDHDNDGLSDYLDLDSDNDGISDKVEYTLSDTDSDYVLNYLDKDSDNDGLSDAFEAGRPAPIGSDADQDGIDDAYDVDLSNGTDEDQDGIDDRFVALDSDADGQANYLDMDSDNDGISDTVEQVLVAIKGFDSDGDGIDDSVDVDITQGIDLNGDGVDDALVNTSDMDDDGIPAYLDLDSDGDGFSDIIENADFDNNGMPDYLQTDTGRVKTGVRGGGSINPFAVFMLLALACFHRARMNPGNRQKKNWLCLSLIVAAFAPSNLYAADETTRKRCIPGVSFVQAHCWYVGVGIGASYLDPEPLGDTLWQVEGTTDTSMKLLLGLNLSQHWFTEISYEQLGAAELKHLNPNVSPNTDSVDYNATSANLGYWLRGLKNTWDVYAKVGLGTLGTNDADSYVYQDHPNQMLIGAGMEWRFSKKWSGRFEFTSYDKDAKSLGLTLTRSFASRTTVRVNKKPQFSALPQATAKPRSATPPIRNRQTRRKALMVKPAPAPIKAPVEIGRVVVEITKVKERDIKNPDRDGDGIINSLDKCSRTTDGVKVDSRGCPQLITVNLNIQFQTGRAIITNDTLDNIDDVIKAINILGNVHVTVEGHTDWQGKQVNNQALSELRATVVADLLMEETKLTKKNFTAIGYGELRPIADNKTAEGRYKNRRVVIVISQQ